MKSILFALFFSAATGTVLGQSPLPPVQMQRIAPGVYVHTSYNLFNGAAVPSNGLLVETPKGLLLIDSGWGEAATADIYNWARKNLKRRIRWCIVTHAHDDRIGGFAFLKKKKVRIISTPQTADLSQKLNLGSPEPLIPNDTTFNFGRFQVRTLYPGPGHAPDNIVVYLPESGVLFGGCLLKSAASGGLGNIADASLEHWGASVKRVMASFPDARIVVPGHGGWEPGAAERTLELLKEKGY